MRDYKSDAPNAVSNCWIYVGGDVEKPNWSKVGITKKGLEVRHRSSQNPDYAIYKAYNVLSDKVDEIEKGFLDYMENEEEINRIPHVSTGTKSECFRRPPELVANLLERYIEDKFGSDIAYENATHGGPSSYQCEDHIRRRLETVSAENLGSETESCSLNRESYFTGNKEVHEIPLGGTLYQDVFSGQIRDRADEEDEDDDL